MKKYFFVSMILLLQTAACSQTNFTVYKVNNMGYISVPPNMELQGGDYKELRQSIILDIGKVDREVLKDRIVFQPEGENERKETGTYARIIAHTFPGEKQEYRSLTKDPSYSFTEIQDLNNMWKDGITNSFIGTGLRVIEWQGVKTKKVKGYYALSIMYLRQLNDKDPVSVEILVFQNNDRRHEITFSYRQKDKDRWSPSFQKTMKDIIINVIQ